MPRKQQKNMNGGGLFEFLGLKTGDQIKQPDQDARIKELEAKSSKDLAPMVVSLETKVKELEQKITKLENPAAATAATTDENPAVKKDELRPATGGRRQRRKTRKSSS